MHITIPAILTISMLSVFGLKPVHYPNQKTHLYLITSPAWDKSQYQSFIHELELYNINTTIVISTEPASPEYEQGYWMYHGLSGPLNNLNFPDNGCGLILLGVPTEVPTESLLPDIPLPPPHSTNGQWFAQWRSNPPSKLDLPNAPILSFSSAKDYLAPPEHAYRHGPQLDFIRLSPINGLPELSHSELVSNPIIPRLIGRWTQAHPCSS